MSKIRNEDGKMGKNQFYSKQVIYCTIKNIQLLVPAIIMCVLYAMS